MLDREERNGLWSINTKDEPKDEAKDEDTSNNASGKVELSSDDEDELKPNKERDTPDKVISGVLHEVLVYQQIRLYTR